MDAVHALNVQVMNQISVLTEQSEDFKKQTGEYMQEMHLSTINIMENNVKLHLEKFEKKTQVMDDCLQQISLQLQELTKKMNSQNRKFQVLDEKLETIENETQCLQSKFTKLRRNMNKKIQEINEKLEGATETEETSNDDD
jgi:archaellum component FlaC